MKKFIIAGVFFSAMGFSGAAFAHSPILNCFDNGDGTITCEGGFSDGSSAAGVKMRITDSEGKDILEGKMNEDSEYSFNKPEGDYRVVFDGGEGHSLEVEGSKIVE